MTEEIDEDGVEIAGYDVRIDVDDLRLLQAEIERLRAALEKIAAPCEVSATADWRVMYEAWRALCVERVDIARAALEGENT